MHRIPKHHSGNTYDVLFWEVELVDVPDCLSELQRPDVWRAGAMSTGSSGRHQCYDCDSPLLTELLKVPARHQEEFILAVSNFDNSNERYFRRSWYHGGEYYVESAHTLAVLNHDEPGFKMGIHIDNSHIMLQTIINLTDNDSGTELYDIHGVEPYHTMTGEKNKGIMFFNGAGALHSIGNINKNRYTLYSAVMYGGRDLTKEASWKKSY
jgi:hypothetical protein